MNTIGDCVSRTRNLLKGVKEDAFLTDRFIWSLILKYGKMLIKRQDNENKIKLYRSLFQTLPCFDLEEVDKIEACCGGVKSHCKIMRTKDTLPLMIDGTNGPIIRGVSSIDNSEYLNPTTPQLFTSIANSVNFKYNKTKYYWVLDNRLYFPNLIWEAINIEALWEDSISAYKCDDKNKCIIRQEEQSPIPDYLIAEVEAMVLKDLGFFLRVPQDTKEDNQSILRT